MIGVQFLTPHSSFLTSLPATITKIGKWAFSGWGGARPQTIVLPFATVEEAVSAWGTDWLQGNDADLVFSILH